MPEADSDAHSSVRRHISTAARIAGALAIVVGVGLAVRGASLHALAAVLASANVPLLVVAVPVLIGLNVILRAARFHALFMRATFREVLASVLVGQAGNNVLPLRAGDLMRTHDFVSRGHPWPRVVSAQVTEKSVELATILAFTIPLLWHGPFGYRPGVALALLFATLAAPIVCLLWRLRGSDRSESFASRAERGVLDFARAFLWSFAADGFELVLIYVCLLSLHIHGGWVASVAVLAAINVAIAIPAAPGNLGTFEAGAAFGLLVCGVPTDAALAFALLYRVIQWAPVTIAGGLVAWLRRQSRPTAPSHGTGDHGCDALV